ncbi:MAG: hypothetical protein H0Z38_01095 [Firmicutes bacterium]|nr:hypothetical protein [Bacillota bacterium]
MDVGHDGGYSGELFTAFSDGGDFGFLITNFCPDCRLGFGWIFAPEPRGVPNLNFFVSNPEVTRFCCAAVDDNEIITGFFQVRCEETTDIGGGLTPLVWTTTPQ